MNYIINPIAERSILKEGHFKLFRQNGLLCCIARMSHSGVLNGYVAVEKSHPFFGKKYSEKITLESEPVFNGNFIGLLLATGDSDHKENRYSLDMALNVHGGLTYSDDGLFGIDKEVFGDLWWFGFDTAHAGDANGFIMPDFPSFPDDEYRDMKYVRNETEKLADQLAQFANKPKELASK